LQDIAFSSDILQTILILVNYADVKYLINNINNLEIVVNKSYNSQNEKTIKCGINLIMNLVERTSDLLNEQYVANFINKCLFALTDAELWESNKIDVIESIGALAMYSPFIFMKYIDNVIFRITEVM